MTRQPLSYVVLMIASALALALAACGGSDSDSDETPTAAATTEQASKTAAATRTPSFNAQGVRYCLYEPGVSEPATMPAEVVNPPEPTAVPTLTPPAQSVVAAETTEQQLEVFDGIRNSITENYVYRDFNGRDWRAIADEYEALVTAGLSEEDFATAMQAMVSELGDNHSYYQSPAAVAEDATKAAAGQNFVGIGVLAISISGTDTGSVIAVFPGSPADEAGIQAHDLLLSVDGQPYRDEDGIARSLGPEGTAFALEFQRPGGEVQSVEMTRRAVSGFLPVDYCIVPETRIGYILLPTFLGQDIDGQVREAIEKMTEDGPLDGMIVDNRMNGGGSGNITTAVLSFFTSGTQGTFTGISGDTSFDIDAEDIGGSQSVPLVVLAGPDTVSYAEVFTGVLKASGRATIVGTTTGGNVEQLHAFDFPDGSRLWLAADAFAPNGLEAGAWEGVGIVPDITVPSRWDLFTEADDPALARAVEILSGD